MPTGVVAEYEDGVLGWEKVNGVHLPLKVCNIWLAFPRVYDTAFRRWYFLKIFFHHAFGNRPMAELMTRYGWQKYFTHLAFLQQSPGARFQLWEGSIVNGLVKTFITRLDVTGTTTEKTWWITTTRTSSRSGSGRWINGYGWVMLTTVTWMWLEIDLAPQHGWLHSKYIWNMDQNLWFSCYPNCEPWPYRCF